MQSIGHDLRRGLNNFNPLGNNYKNINKWLAELKNIDSSLKTLDKEIMAEAKFVSGWGTNEGDDLTDVCQRMTQLMEEVGLVHQAYSMQHTAYRKKIKSLKIQEMTLDDNRKKKHDLTNQIAKLQKSNKENPIKLMELQSALERVTAELAGQELELLQFKRVTLRDAFNAKFDAMIEYAEKMALISGYGRQITEVIDTGPQEPDRTTLYGGAEFTAATINQVKLAVTSWQPAPISGPSRTHIVTQDELALSAAAAAYNTHTPPLGQYSPNSNSHGFVKGGAAATAGGGRDVNNTDQWDEAQLMRSSDASQGSGQDGRHDDFENWKRDALDKSDENYGAPPPPPPPPGSGPEPSPYIHSQQLNLQEQQRQLQIEQQRVYQHHLSFSPETTPSQQHYQNAANSYRHSDMEYNGSGPSSGTPRDSGSGRFTPSALRRNDTQELYYSTASPSPSYTSYQHQPASYDTSTTPSRPYRLGFIDPRERNRVDRMDNGDLYKTEMGGGVHTAGPRYPKNTAAIILDEK
ncbi:hypothetical protein BGZ94_006881 [Podila epigama]|nr:hypothetical protein BGZ94_006881 [Podila epigama]